MCLGREKDEGFLSYLMPLQSPQGHTGCEMALWCYGPFILDQFRFP